MLVVMLVLAFLFLRVHRSLHDAAFTRAVHRKPQTRAATFDTLSLTDRGRYLRLTFFAIRGFIIAVLAQWRATQDTGVWLICNDASTTVGAIGIDHEFVLSSTAKAAVPMVCSCSLQNPRSTNTCSAVSVTPVRTSRMVSAPVAGSSSTARSRPRDSLIITCSISAHPHVPRVHHWHSSHLASHWAWPVA